MKGAIERGGKLISGYGLRRHDSALAARSVCPTRGDSLTVQPKREHVPAVHLALGLARLPLRSSRLCGASVRLKPIAPYSGASVARTAASPSRPGKRHHSRHSMARVSHFLHRTSRSTDCTRHSMNNSRDSMTHPTHSMTFLRKKFRPVSRFWKPVPQLGAHIRNHAVGEADNHG